MADLGPLASDILMVDEPTRQKIRATVADLLAEYIAHRKDLVNQAQGDFIKCPNCQGAKPRRGTCPFCELG